MVKSCCVPIQHPARIEAAIRNIGPAFLKATTRAYHNDPNGRIAIEADLLRWVLGQEQDTWEDKDFGLKETPNQKGG